MCSALGGVSVARHRRGQISSQLTDCEDLVIVRFFGRTIKGLVQQTHNESQHAH